MQSSKPDQTPLKRSDKPEELQSQTFLDGSALIDSATGIWKLEPSPRSWGHACTPASTTPHPFAHLPTIYGLTAPLRENRLLAKWLDPATVEALSDEALTAAMKEEGTSAEWMQLLSATRISQLLQHRFALLMTYSFHPHEERLRRRLACLILRERYLSVPYYAEKDARMGEQHWITFQTGCYNE